MQPIRNMKSKLYSFLLAGLTLGAASIALAGPGPEYWQTLRQAEQFRQLKAGDKVIYVCNQCQSVTEQTIASTAQAMEHCKEGATVMCPECKQKSTVVLKTQRNDAPVGRKVVYVNAKGEECLFVAKVVAKP